jgi:hypothetical protein
VESWVPSLAPRGDRGTKKEEIENVFVRPIGERDQELEKRLVREGKKKI